MKNHNIVVNINATGRYECNINTIANYLNDPAYRMSGVAFKNALMSLRLGYQPFLDLLGISPDLWKRLDSRGSVKKEWCIIIDLLTELNEKEYL